MTKEEALTSHVIYRLTLYACKADLASVEFYTKWLVDNGHLVKLEVVEENGARRVLTLAVDGREIVRNGVYVSQKEVIA